MKAFYFGCQGKNAPGHYYFWAPEPGALICEYAAEKRFPEGSPLLTIDGTFMQEAPARSVLDLREPVEQVEGLAWLHHLDGFTVMAFWDRSADPRGRSNSAFVFEGKHDFEKMKQLAEEWFPKIWERMTSAFEIRRAPQGTN